MLNFGASKPRVKGGGPGPRGPPLDPHLSSNKKEKLLLFALHHVVYMYELFQYVRHFTYLAHKVCSVSVAPTARVIEQVPDEVHFNSCPSSIGCFFPVCPRPSNLR